MFVETGADSQRACVCRDWSRQTEGMFAQSGADRQTDRGHVFVETGADSQRACVCRLEQTIREHVFADLSRHSEGMCLQRL